MKQQEIEKTPCQSSMSGVTFGNSKQNGQWPFRGDNDAPKGKSRGTWIICKQALWGWHKSSIIDITSRNSEQLGRSFHNVNDTLEWKPWSTWVFRDYCKVDASLLWATWPSKTIDNMCDLLSGCLTHPTIPKNKLKCIPQSLLLFLV